MECSDNTRNKHETHTDNQTISRESPINIEYSPFISHDLMTKVTPELIKQKPKDKLLSSSAQNDETVLNEACILNSFSANNHENKEVLSPDLPINSTKMFETIEVKDSASIRAILKNIK